ncbi:MAG TPA: type 2 lanthipeptide synthetase LanM family protein [Actinomycetales bacterium]|nr:type 2 lanthipeptide synthetase LanM family protein [Actinomycetales bacterium]
MEHEPWERPEWFRALSLTERLRLPVPPEGPTSRGEAAAETARSRLDAWKNQRPFDDEALFAQRLALDALAEAELIALLAEPAENLRARTPDHLEWLLALRAAYATPGRPELTGYLDDVEVDHPLRGCLPALAPLLARGLASVRRRLAALREGGETVPVGDDRLIRAFLTNIAPLVLFEISKPVVLEVHAARIEGRLAGETPEARFEDFLRQLCDEGLFLSLLARYPVLARQLVVAVEQWAEYLAELLEHLAADRASLAAAFTAGRDPGAVVDLEAGMGDRHRRGRSVLQLTFESGLRLIYKPRSLTVDVHFQELLRWVNRLGAEPSLRPLTLLDRGDHGWCEFVEVSSCGSREEVARFYQRLGSYLALLYVLDAADLHNENLVAAGEHPTLVDLEALFHPRVYGADPRLANLAAGALDESVWQIGLLPRRVWAGDDSVGVDMSGFGGQPGQLNPHRLMAWESPGTDEMRLVRRRVELPASDNRPRLVGQDVDVLDYQDDIVGGFDRTYRLLCRNRESLLRELLPRFADDRIRAVIRSTNVYGLLWYESFHPELLRDALDRDRFFDRLWVEAASRPYLARIIAAERRDLWRDDVPLFTTSPGSRLVRGSDGEVLDGLLDVPSLDSARRRVQRLDERDLAKQRWVVEASLATLGMSSEEGMRRPPRPPAGAARTEQKRLLSLAASLADRVGELAFQDENGAYWLGVGPLDETTWGVYPSGTGLYAGTGGIVLFLAYCGAVGAEPSYTRLARRGLTSLRAQLNEIVSESWARVPATSTPAVGGFEGLSSDIYVLACLGTLWGDSELLEEATAISEALPLLVSRDRFFDVVYGSAGCILALLALHSVRPRPQVLDVAVQCGDRILAAAHVVPEGLAWVTLKGQPPLGGFSHGAAGIATALLQLAARSGEERFREAALQALAFDRSLFVPEIGNWADLRIFASRTPSSADPSSEAKPPISSMVAWCHGAAGIGLARLATLDQLDDASTREEIDDALDATTRLGFAVNHSLCHGALGNAELLLTAARTLDRPRDHEALERATSEIVASLEANGPVTGVPQGVETPGFMTGLAGMGYELLRLAEPGKVPAALVLAPPGWHA